MQSLHITRIFFWSRNLTATVLVFVFFGHVIKPQFFYFFQDWHTKDKHFKEQLTSDSLHIAQTVYTQVFSRRLQVAGCSTTYQLPSSVILSCLILQQNSTLIRCNLWTSSMENSFAKTGKFRWTLAKNVLELCKETVSIFQYFQVKQSFRKTKRTSCI